MEIFGIDILNLVTNPLGAIAAAATTAATGIIFFQLWNIINSILKPVSYVDKLYDLADKIVERADDTIIDKIRNKKIKGDIQKQLEVVLRARKVKISELIKRISD